MFKRLLKILGVVFSGFVCFLAYGCIFTVVLGHPLPKTSYLEYENARLKSHIKILDQHIDEKSRELQEIHLRDNVVYRTLFGMEQIQFESIPAGNLVSESISRKADLLARNAVIQSKSFDEVSAISHRSGEMAACIPNITPVDMHFPNVHFTSSFGVRMHPIFHTLASHHGIDIRGPVGLPVYATAGGVVETVEQSRYGYGNFIVLNHGFGYKTRYAHLRNLFVTEGQTVSRGDRIATLGSTGRSTGPHLHYEVIFHNRPVNPWNYLDDLPASEYRKLIHN